MIFKRVIPDFSPAFVAKRWSWRWLSRTQRFGCGMRNAGYRLSRTPFSQERFHRVIAAIARME